MEQKDYERITALETQLETLTKSVERIETKLDLLKGTCDIESDKFVCSLKEVNTCLSLQAFRGKRRL